MASLHEASFYERLPDNRVHCTLCPHQCRIGEGSRGACAVRFNQDGVLYTVVYDRIVARDVEPIEKKPLFHFMPWIRRVLESPPLAAICAARSARTGRSRSGRWNTCRDDSPGR